jgi:hypothetical protein
MEISMTGSLMREVVFGDFWEDWREDGSASLRGLRAAEPAWSPVRGPLMVLIAKVNLLGIFSRTPRIGPWTLPAQ